MTRSRHWPRWIKASVNTHFAPFAEAAQLELYIEGASRKTNEEISFAELRMTGPIFTEQSSGYWCIDIVIDVLVNQKLVKNDIYAFDRAIGTMFEAFTNDIAVFKLGSGVDDAPSEQLGCLTLDPTERESIIVTNFGAPNKDVAMLQATIEASYQMHLS